MTDQSKESMGEEFRLGKPVGYGESRKVEFKELVGKRPINSIINTSDEYAVAFLNSDGGKILWGIEDKKHTVVGVSLTEKEKDRLNRTVSNKLSEIQPPVDPTQFRILTHPVKGTEDKTLYVVELQVPKGNSTEVYYTGGNECFVRTDGIKKKIRGPALSEFVKRRSRSKNTSSGTLTNELLLQLVKRIRMVFHGHDLLETRWIKFFEELDAPFGISTHDIINDESLLSWLDEEKLNWICDTFLVQREWIEGEDVGIHQKFYFDKQPNYFFETIKEALDKANSRKVKDTADAFFIRNINERSLVRSDRSDVYVVIRFPLARFSNECRVYQYISDSTPYPWNYERCHIQLRAWARLLELNLNIYCFGCGVEKDSWAHFECNDRFLHFLCEKKLQHNFWHPGDYAHYKSESVAAKDLDNLPYVIEFLRGHDLPYKEIPLRLGSD